MEEIEALKKDIKEGFQSIDRKLDLLLNPKTGVFSELSSINTKADRAHERISELRESHERLKTRLTGDMNSAGLEDDVASHETRIEILEEHKGRIMGNLRKAFWYFVGPMIGMIALWIWITLSGGK